MTLSFLGDDYLEVRDLTVDFDGFKAIQDIDVTFVQGRLHFLIGPNGAGKTTLVDALDRLEAVEVDGQVAHLEIVLADEGAGHAATPAVLRRRDASSFSLGRSEVIPNGRNRSTTMNSPPWK